MNITLENGRVLVDCPRCQARLALGPPRHRITVGLTAGLTVTPAVVCPGCSRVFDVRKGETRSLGQYALPPARLAYEPAVQRRGPAGLVLSAPGGGRLGELAELANPPATGASLGVGAQPAAEALGPAPAAGAAVPGETPLVEAKPDEPESNIMAVVGEPDDFTAGELRKQLTRHRITPAKGNKNTMLARLREHYGEGCKCDLPPDSP